MSDNPASYSSVGRLLSSNYDFMLLTFLAKSVFIFESMGFEGFHCKFKIGIRIEPLCVGTQYGIHPAA